MINEIGKKEFFQTQHENSFHYTAPRLFNKLPRNLRDDMSSDLLQWKEKLDKFLSKIPDTPQVSNLTPGLCEYYQSKPTNSIFYWTPFLGLNTKRKAADINIG